MEMPKFGPFRGLFFSLRPANFMTSTFKLSFMFSIYHVFYRSNESSMLSFTLRNRPFTKIICQWHRAFLGFYVFLKHIRCVNLNLYEKINSYSKNSLCSLSVNHHFVAYFQFGEKSLSTFDSFMLSLSLSFTLNWINNKQSRCS